MIYLGSDHAGYQLKEVIKRYLKENQYEVIDLGTDSATAPVDYPDFAFSVAEKVALDDKAKGILICRSGNGMCMAANKIKGVRAALGYSAEAAEKSREDNDANILCLSGEINENNAIKIIKSWLLTKFSQEKRHIRRINKINKK